MTVQASYQLIVSELSLKVFGGRPIPPGSTLDVFASIVATLHYSNRLSLDRLYNNLLPSTAIGNILDLWGETFGVLRRSQDNATGTVVFTTSGAATIPVGTLLTRCDGVEYETTSEVSTTVAGQLSVPVEAVEPGSASNYISGGPLTVSSGIANVSTDALSGGISGGLLDEGDEAYRARVLSRIARRCRTGTRQDYIDWVTETPGVNVTLVGLPMKGVDNLIKPTVLVDNRLPTAIELTTIQTYVESQLPFGVLFTVCAPTLQPIDVCVTKLPVVTVAVQNALEAALISTISTSFDQTANKVSRHAISAAIAGVVEDDCFELMDPTSNAIIAAGSVPVLGDLFIA